MREEDDLSFLSHVGFYLDVLVSLLNWIKNNLSKDSFIEKNEALHILWQKKLFVDFM